MTGEKEKNVKGKEINRRVKKMKKKDGSLGLNKAQQVKVHVALTWWVEPQNG
jgi:hypothetical protein